MNLVLPILRIITTLIVVLSSSLLYAQSGINYQGVARNTEGQLMVSESIDLEILIRKGVPNGTIAYGELHNVMTDANGVFSIVIGQGIPSAIPYDLVSWAEDTHYLNVWLNGVEVGTTQFLGVPYAYAIGKWQAHKNGVTPKGTGGSIYIGDNVGQDDDFSDNNNIGIGSEALKSNINGYNNIALGSESLSLSADTNTNIGIGTNTLKKNTGSNANIAMGVGSLSNLETSNAIGYRGNNLAIGFNALHNNIDGTRNIALGNGALYHNINGTRNIAIGVFAGLNNLGTNNIFIGSSAGSQSDFHNANNTLVIDNAASGSVTSIPLIYGEFDNHILGFDAKVGIGTTAPNAPLHITTNNDVSLEIATGVVVLGNELEHNLAMDGDEIQARNGGLASDLFLQNEGGNVRVGGTIVYASDRRLKEDIQDISFGLNEILMLRPTEYFWKNKIQKHKSLGLIAQEVNEVIESIVTYDKKQDKYGVSYTELIPVLIKAIQEQQIIINKQDKIMQTFAKRLAVLEENLGNK